MKHSVSSPEALFLPKLVEKVEVLQTSTMLNQRDALFAKIFDDWLLSIVMVDDNIRIKNALYGVKTELKERLRNDDIPRWFHSPSNHETARERWESARDPNGLHAHPTFQVYCSNMPSSGARPPERVLQRLDDYWENQKENDADRRIPPEQGYRFKFLLSVDTGAQGGINDIYIDAHFKN